MGRRGFCFLGNFNSLNHVGAELGTVEAGKLADLIVVAANPLEDITNLRRLQLVLKEGRVVSDKRHLSGPVP
jgi:imidazolonepropionase-like amidohydrolase